MTTVLFPQEPLCVYGMGGDTSSPIKSVAWRGVPWAERKRRGIVSIAVGGEKGQPVWGMCLCWYSVVPAAAGYQDSSSWDSWGAGRSPFYRTALC